MITLSFHSDQNLIIVKTSGVISPAEVKKIIPKLKESVALFNPDFRIIHDISQLRTYDPENFELLKSIHEMLREKGAGKIIRVVGSARDTLFKFAKFDYDNNIAKSEFVPDIETAFNILGIQDPDESIK